MALGKDWVAYKEFGGVDQSAPPTLKIGDFQSLYNMYTDHKGVLRPRPAYQFRVTGIQGDFASGLGFDYTNVVKIWQIDYLHYGVLVSMHEGAAGHPQVGSMAVFEVNVSGAVNGPYYPAGPNEVWCRSAIVYDQDLYVGAYSDAPATESSIWKYDPTLNTWTKIYVEANAKEIRKIILHRDRLWRWVTQDVSATSTTPRIEWSELGDFTTWTGNSIDIPSSWGENIRDVVEYNGGLMIFTESNTHFLSTDGTEASWSLRQVSDRLGCICPNLSVVADNLLYFVSKDGVYRTDGTTFEALSSNITELEDVVISSIMTFTQGAFVFGNFIWFHIDSATDWLYNYKTNTWVEWDAIKQSRAYTQFEGHIYCLKESGGLNRLVEVKPYHTDESEWYDFGEVTGIYCVARSGPLDFGDPVTTKKINQVNIEGHFPYNQGINVIWEKDENTTVDTGVEELVDNPAPAHRMLKCVKPPGYCRYLVTNINFYLGVESDGDHPWIQAFYFNVSPAGPVPNQLS